MVVLTGPGEAEHTIQSTQYIVFTVSALHVQSLYTISQSHISLTLLLLQHLHCYAPKVSRRSYEAADRESA